MLTASLTLDPAFTISPVRRRTFGSFVEHLGRCVYTGLHDPAHPTADADGFRGDVVGLTRELGVSTVRYPGGNFVSGYRWEDGVGPVGARPARLDLAWHSTEPNTVGLDEFMRWCAAAGVEPMMAVNLGTRGVQEALDLLEYCNVAAGSHFSDLRRANGTEQPHNIRMWCLGNEMDGPWQIGHKTAQEYGRLAAETARAMRMIDPDLELVACGSSSSAMPTFGAWEATVLTEAYEQVDFISAHAYYFEEDGDLASFLGSAINMDRFIEDVVATADAVRAAQKLTKRLHISFDEWNVWYLNAAPSKPPTDDWPVAPVLLEDHYSVADAVVVGNLLISLLRHSDRVRSASLAQLVNVIAPIMTEPGGRIWRQTTFHPFALTSRYAVGDVLRVELSSPAAPTAKFGDTPLVDAIATRDAGTGAVAVFAVNRSVSEPLVLDIDLRALGAVELVECVTLANPDPYARATADDDRSVAPRENTAVTREGDLLRVELPPVSWTMVRLAS
ncbi:arabinosylfuranosidase ArfA [Pengzhenrongella sicca]|uniref:non-reducing end alpha-L-arabinofuranosidase n=1 Tax=Pengzhenrongella sicca TaxID=2819238 RepID=A0A8A4ZB90_9MICO|nr:alpha-N-arabinofuranosidase [Pengzhenrongella sicca]QTE29154.1 alpha-N-arabinofuranosidase [Pengzhenrongella sicca]